MGSLSGVTVIMDINTQGPHIHGYWSSIVGFNVRAKSSRSLKLPDISDQKIKLNLADIRRAMTAAIQSWAWSFQYRTVLY
jgi:hypothetical protein